MSVTEEISALRGLRESVEEQVGKNQAREASARQKVLTDKGKEYEVSMVKKRAESFKSKWNRVSHKIIKTLKSVLNPFELQSLSGKEEELFNQYVAAY